MSSNSSNNNDTWIYHELQSSLLCGQHALNNLVQHCVFVPEKLAEIAHQLDEMELAFMAQNNEGGIESKDYLRRVSEGSGNVDAHGNFSIQVLRSALQTRYNIELPNLKEEGYVNQEPTTMEGFICNKHSHWFAIRKINGRYWNLNSTKEQPELISHFNMATELQKLMADGYSVFCVSKDKKLPSACTSTKEMQGRKASTLYNGGIVGNWWRESDLLSGKITPGVQFPNHDDNNNNGQHSHNNSQNGNGKKAAAGAPIDPWKNVGSGMRLDGKSTTVSVPDSPMNWRQTTMSEEEQLQFAMAASLESPHKVAKTDAKASPTATIVPTVTVPPEPSAGTAGSVRIQFRLPSKPRLVRRFMETDTVAVILQFAKDQEDGKNLDLRYGFPPKDLKPLASQTIAEAKLAGESIQGRAV